MTFIYNPTNRLLFKGGFIKHWILGSVKLVYLQNFLGIGHAGGL